MHKCKYKYNYTHNYTHTHTHTIYIHKKASIIKYFSKHIGTFDATLYRHNKVVHGTFWTETHHTTRVTWNTRSLMTSTKWLLSHSVRGYTDSRAFAV